MTHHGGKPVRSMAICRPLGHWRRMAFRMTVSLALSGLFVWLLVARLADIDLAAVGDAVGAVATRQWLLAMLFTALSFWAVGHYDAVLHQHFASGIPAAVARRAGICAIAVSQMLGLGMITGTILRWRMLPGQSLWFAAQLTGSVALSFLASWAVVTALTIMILPAAPFKLLATFTLVIGVAAALLCIARPRLRCVTFRWPNCYTVSRLLALCLIDTFAAASAFHMLCPPDLALPVQILLPAFLLALGAGLMAGSPGGIGAFEVAMLALLPGQPEAELLGAILAWRIVYFALPAIAGGLIAAFGPAGAHPGPRPLATALPLYLSPRAEVQILSQGEHQLTATGPAQAWLTARTNHVLAGLFDPIGSAPQDRSGFAALSRIARREGRICVLYKCTSRTAGDARRSGQVVQLIAREAWLDPCGYRLAAATRAGLRRKLRLAIAAGVSVSSPPDLRSSQLPLAEMCVIATAWAQTHGGERGFSMGRYCPTYVQSQRVYLAHHAGKLIAFITLHEGHSEWTLDLMRHGASLPHGTMHLLLQTAIEDAQRRNLPRISLAAVREHAGPLLKNRFTQHLLRRCPGSDQGLVQFKSSFAPQWQRLYMVAANRTSLAIATLSIARAIIAPPPLQHQIEHLHEQYEFAPAHEPWQRH